jgi:hypothetical protein
MRKIQFKKNYKHPKSKSHLKKSKNTVKIILAILLIIHQLIAFSQTIETAFLQNFNFKIIHFMYFAIVILMKLCIK